MAIRKGLDYIKALQDGRDIWHAVRRIEDVTQHAGFIRRRIWRNGALFTRLSHRGANSCGCQCNTRGRNTPSIG